MNTEQHLAAEKIKLQHHVTYLCFDTCVNNFRIRFVPELQKLSFSQCRDLDRTEGSCVDRCSDKFLNHFKRASRVYKEQVTLQQQDLEAQQHLARSL